ncbi:PilZ domain-containing protein [Flavisphingopyxis soli]|uniref:PilZ domain-containing protein n=1 Tax=Flavisphingopyxis soli TaxID=2601267 RepID=UPI002E259B1B
MSAIRHESYGQPPPGNDGVGEDRAAPRFRTLLQSARLIGEKSQSLCIVRDVSETGMKVRLFGTVAVDDRVCVEFKGGRTVFASVKWIEDRFAGLAFETPIDLQKIFDTAQPEYSYRAPRLEIDATATVTFGRAKLPMTILDISTSGIKLLGGDALIRGEDVTIDIEGLVRSNAVVKWKASDLVGLELEHPIPVERLADWASSREFRRSLSDMVSI